MADRLWELPMKIGGDYNEGWNAYLADRAMEGAPLYSDRTAVWTNNYPPLSFYVVGVIGFVLGDNIIAGRFIAFVSLLAVAANIFFLVSKFGGTRFAAATATLFFLAYQATHAHAYVALNDPQWLAHALMIVGFSMFAYRGQSMAMVTGAAVTMVAAGMVKHLLIAAPLAVTIWIALFDRRLFLSWVAVAGGSVVAALVLCHLLYGPNFLHSVFLTPRVVSAGLAATKIVAWFMPLQVPLIGAALVALYGFSRDVALALLLVVMGLLEALLAIAGTGVSYNAAFDLMIGLSILSGLAIDKTMAMGGPTARSAAVAALALPILLAVPARMQAVKHRLLALPSYGKNWNSEVQRVRTINGRVACETLSLCYWAGKDFEVDFFNYGQKLAVGAVGLQESLMAIEARNLAALQVEKHGTPASIRFPDALNEALAQRYNVTPSLLPGHAVLVRKSAIQPK
jgi:hypothetical protein